jgi:hypothetical protein
MDQADQALCHDNFKSKPQYVLATEGLRKLVRMLKYARGNDGRCCGLSG